MKRAPRPGRGRHGAGERYRRSRSGVPAGPGDRPALRHLEQRHDQRRDRRSRRAGDLGRLVFHLFRVADLVTPTASVRLRFVAAYLGAGSLIEGRSTTWLAEG